MLLNLSFLSFFLLVNKVILIALATYMFSRRDSKGALQLSMLLFNCAWWSFCSSMESAAMIMEEKVFWAKLSYVSISTVGPIWLLFGAEYSQLKQKVIDSLRRLVWIVPIIVMTLIFTNELHLWMWPQIRAVSTNVGAPLIYTHGILFYLNMAYEYILLSVGTFLLIRFVIKEKALQRRQVFLICFGIFFPWLANFFYVVFGSTIGGVEYTPFAMSLTGIIFAYTIYRYKLFAALPEAKDAVFQSIQSGIVIIDGDLLVVDSNSAAKKIFGKSFKNGTDMHQLNVPFGKDLCAIARSKSRNSELYLEHLKKWVEVQIYELADFKEGMAGCILFLYDITALKEIQLALEEAKHLASSIIDFLPDALFVLDNTGKVVIWNKAMEKMTKIDAEHMIGKTDNAYAVPFYGKRRPGLASMILDPSLLVEKKWYRNLKRQGDVLMAEVDLPKSVVWAIAKPLYNNEGKIIGAIESIRDITDRRRMENELTERVETLSKVNDIMLKREDRMAEMKRKLEKLEGN